MPGHRPAPGHRLAPGHRWHRGIAGIGASPSTRASPASPGTGASLAQHPATPAGHSLLPGSRRVEPGGGGGPAPPPAAGRAVPGGPGGAGAGWGTGCSSASSSAAGRDAPSPTSHPLGSGGGGKGCSQGLSACPPSARLPCRPPHPRHPAPTWLSSRAAMMPGASDVRTRCSVARRLLSFRRTNLSPLPSGEDERRLWSEPAESWAVLVGGGEGWHCPVSPPHPSLGHFRV